MIRLTIFAALIASTAHANVPWTVDDGTGTGGHVPNPECTRATCDGSPFLPPEPEPSQPKGDTDRDPQPATTQPGYGMCCTVNGQAFSHADLLSRLFLGVERAELRAKAACDAKAVKYECSNLSKWAMGVE